MIDRPALKATAKQQIKGNLPNLIIITLILGFVSIIPLVGQILTPALSLCLVMVFLNLSYGNAPQISDCFAGLKYLGKAWWLTIITAFFTFLWSLLLVIPGMIKAISYSMAPFILADDPTLTAQQALNISKQITDGYKMEMFLLALSFIGWFLLIPLTYGIAALWVIPYASATFTNFYQTIKKNKAAA